MRKEFWINWFGWILIIGFILLHWFLISKTFFVDTLGNFRTASAGYGDIPLHLTQISKFAFTRIGDWSDPIFYGAKLQYPFVLNMISGLILRFSHNWTISVMWPIYFLAAANITLLFLIYKKILKNALWSFLSVLIFFLGGGMGGYKYIYDAIINHQSFQQFTQFLTDKTVSTITLWGAIYPNQNIDFGAPLSLVFLHQRTFFLGLFGYLIVLWLLIKLTEKTSLKTAIWLGIIIGILPLCHTHGYVAAVILVGVLLLISLCQKNIKLAKLTGLSIIIGLVISFPQLWYLVGTKDILISSTSFLTFRLGWMLEPTIGSFTHNNTTGSIFSFAYLKFLWVNFGLILPLFLLSFMTIKKDLKLKVLFFGSLALFLSVMIIRFQPWDYDDNKMLVYFLVLAVPLIVYLMMKICERFKTIGIIIIAISSILLLFSGLMDNLPRFMAPKANMPVIFSTSDQKIADYIRTNIAEYDLILTGESHLNIVSSLCGRDVLVGYPGWLWSRGIKYSTREKEIKDFYTDPSQTSQILSDYPVKYILLDDSTKNSYNTSSESFDQLFSRVYKTGDNVLYKVKS